MKFLNNLDVNLNELQNARLQNLGSDPTPAATNRGMIWLNTAGSEVKASDGTNVLNLTNIIESVSGTSPIQVGAVSNRAQAISILAASGSNAGSMSAADFTKLANATSNNTVSTIVMRDGSGNFSAGTITAALTGTASNAAQLNGQAASFYLSRANHTGTQLAATISDFDTQVRTNRLDQLAAPTAPVSMGTQRITSVGAPTAATDAATKSYVDGVASGLDVKASVRLASVANVSATYSATGGTSGRGQITAAPNTLDGVNLAANDRILLKNQTTGAQNGIYVVTTLGSGANGVWDRATDFDTDAEVTDGAFTFIEEGTQAGTGWVLTTNNPITIGGASGTALVFAQFSGGASYTAGNGLQLAGQQFSVVGTTNRISVSGAGVDIAATYVGQTSITTLGTITTGVWNGTAVPVLYGGTGATTATAARTNLGATGKFAATIGDGSSTSIPVTHNLNSTDVVVAVYEVATNQDVYANIVHTSANVVTLGFSTAPASNALRVIVVG